MGSTATSIGALTGTTFGFGFGFAPGTDGGGAI